jgi:hypothetical protein
MDVSSQFHAPANSPPGERSPGTHWIGGWVVPKAGVDFEKHRKISCPCQGQNSGRSARIVLQNRLSHSRSSYIIIRNILDEDKPKFNVPYNVQCGLPMQTSRIHRVVSEFKHVYGLRFATSLLRVLFIHFVERLHRCDSSVGTGTDLIVSKIYF